MAYHDRLLSCSDCSKELHPGALLTLSPHDAHTQGSQSSSVF
jgi:hypothetical protein